MNEHNELPQSFLSDQAWRDIRQLVDHWRANADREESGAADGGNVRDMLEAGELARVFRYCAIELERLLPLPPQSGAGK